MKTFIFFISILLSFSVSSQKTLDSIRTYYAEQGVFKENFIRQYFIYHTDSIKEYEDEYLSNLKVYNKKYLRVSKLSQACSEKITSYTEYVYNQFNEKYDNSNAFLFEYDQNCNQVKLINYDYNKMDTFFIAYYDLYTAQGNDGSEIVYYDFDGNGLKKIVDTRKFYTYNGLNQVATIETKDNIFGEYILTSRRIYEYNSNGDQILNRFFVVDLNGVEKIIFEYKTTYFNGGFVGETFSFNSDSNVLYSAALDSSFIDSDNDVYYVHSLNKTISGETSNDVKKYYYYEGSSATKNTALDNDIAINRWVNEAGTIRFEIENPKGKNFKVYLYDISGKIIYQGSSNESSWHSPQININSGLYVLKVETKDGVKVQKKIAY